MEIINAQYIDRNNTVIRAVIDGTATSVPVCPGNREYDEIVRQGVEIVPYVAPAVTWDSLRFERNRKLDDCDWTQLADAPLTDEEKAEWSAYRQALRDLPEAYPDAAAAVWPEEPNA